MYLVDLKIALQSFVYNLYILVCFVISAMTSIPAFPLNFGHNTVMYTTPFWYHNPDPDTDKHFELTYMPLVMQHH